MTVDLASPEAIDEAGAQVRARHGTPDLVFNNAGINGGFLLNERVAALNVSLEILVAKLQMRSRKIRPHDDGQVSFFVVDLDILNLLW